MYRQLTALMLLSVMVASLVDGLGLGQPFMNIPVAAQEELQQAGEGVFPEGMASMPRRIRPNLMAWLSAEEAADMKPLECPKLESRLYQVARSSDPEYAAKQSGLHYSQGRVRVIIELADPAASPPASYSLIIEGRYNGLIQALVALQDLCKLSQELSVRLIRAPYEAAPLEKRRPR